MKLIEIESLSRDVEFDLWTLKPRPHQLAAHITSWEGRLNGQSGLGGGHREVATECIHNGLCERADHRCVQLIKLELTQIRGDADAAVEGDV